MAFLEFFNKQKDETNLKKTSSEQSVFHAYGVNKNVRKLFYPEKIDNMTHNNILMRGNSSGNEAPIQPEKTKRNSKSEENIFEKCDFGRLSKSSSSEKTKDEPDDQKVVTALRNRFKFRNSSDDLNPTGRRSNSLEDQNNSSSASASATSSTEFLEEQQSNANADKMMSSLHQTQSSGVPMTDAQGLIVPKKLTNPILESQSHQSLHRELMFNQKVGKPVLNQKSELQRALEKQKERQLMAAQQQQKKEELTIENELNKVIMQRAARLENSQKENNKQNELDHYISPEYLNARAKLKHTIDMK